MSHVGLVPCRGAMSHVGPINPFSLTNCTLTSSGVDERDLLVQVPRLPTITPWLSVEHVMDICSEYIVFVQKEGVEPERRSGRTEPKESENQTFEM